MNWDELFGGGLNEAEIEELNKNMELAREEEANRVKMVKLNQTERQLRQITNRCPRCMGAGKLPQFVYRAGGVCFKCGGSGMI